LASGFGDIVARKSILVCVGSGGVGKTTTAAAMAIEAARQGKRTLVLTIDPARRLANSLGLSTLGHDVQPVPEDRLRAAGIARAGGSLHAMMLDQKRAFDEVVERYASDPAAALRILDNPVYAQISGSLAGSQEYAALAKLQEFDESGDYDMIVVDTPPTAHALDFLDAPEKLTNAIDSPAIEWFRSLRTGSWSVVGRTGAYILKRLSKFVGSRFLDDLAVFFTEFNDILGGFRSRAEQTFALLRQPRVGFVLVASPEPMAIREALFFHQRLLSSTMPFAGFVVNKVHDDLPLSAPPAEVERALAASPAVAGLGFQPSTMKIAAEALLGSHADLQLLAAADRESVDRLRTASEEAILVVVPFFKEDIYDIDRLSSLGRYLFAGDELDVSAGAG
jgi:anion-transporting  ArsA/GET3 family ATPase